MANNNAIYNAAISGLTGGSQNRWLTSLNSTDYDMFRIQINLIATEIDSLIAEITDGPTIAEIQLMQSICQGVFSARLVNAEDNFAAIAGAIVTLWQSVRSDLLTNAAINLEGNGGGNALLGGVLQYDDFLSSREIVNPGSGVQDGLGPIGNTGWQAICVGITSGVAIGPSPVTTARSRGIIRLSSGGVNTGTSVARGVAFNDVTVCKAGDVQILDFLFGLNAQDSDTSGLTHNFGFANEWDGSASGFMVINRTIATEANWRIVRTGAAAIDTGLPAASVNGPWFFRLQQRQDEVTGLGNGNWDLFLGPDFTTPVVENFAGGTFAGNPATEVNYGAQVVKTAVPGVQATCDLDAIGEQFFETSFANRIAA